MKWLALAVVLFAACAPCTESVVAASNVSCGVSDGGVVLVESRHMSGTSPEVVACLGRLEGATLQFSVTQRVCTDAVEPIGAVFCSIPELPSGRYPLPGGEVLVLPNDGGTPSCEK